MARLACALMSGKALLSRRGECPQHIKRGSRTRPLRRDTRRLLLTKAGSGRQWREAAKRVCVSFAGRQQRICGLSRHVAHCPAPALRRHGGCRRIFTSWVLHCLVVSPVVPPASYSRPVEVVIVLDFLRIASSASAALASATAPAGGPDSKGFRLRYDFS